MRFVCTCVKIILHVGVWFLKLLYFLLLLPLKSAFIWWLNDKAKLSSVKLTVFYELVSRQSVVKIHLQVTFIVLNFKGKRQLLCVDIRNC